MVKEHNNYQAFRSVRTKEEFFASWTKETMDAISNNDRDRLYQHYTVKCEVLQRDSFKCQNDECKWPKSTLTIHHVKWQKNGGDWVARNCVTICKTCHQAFHKGKRGIVFNPEADNLPPHIRGHTFKIATEAKVNMKKVLADAKKIRKEFKYKYPNYRNKTIPWSLIQLLIKWLDGEEDFEEL